jgi:hypothetical protein
VEELEHVDGARRRADAGDREPSSPRRSRRPANSAASALATGLPRVRRTGAPARSSRTRWSAAAIAARAASRRSSGSPPSAVSTPALSFSHTPRGRDEQVRPHRGQVARDLPRVRAGRRLEALGEREGVVQHAVHHVRRRQPGDDPCTSSSGIPACQPRSAAITPLGQLDALRCAVVPDV